MEPEPSRLVIERLGARVTLILDLPNEHQAIRLADGLARELVRNGTAQIKVDGAQLVKFRP
jgi:hypothetical protein